MLDKLRIRSPGRANCKRNKAFHCLDSLFCIIIVARVDTRMAVHTSKLTWLRTSQSTDILTTTDSHSTMEETSCPAIFGDELTWTLEEEKSVVRKVDKRCASSRPHAPLLPLRKANLMLVQTDAFADRLLFSTTVREDFVDGFIGSRNH